LKLFLVIGIIKADVDWAPRTHPHTHDEADFFFGLAVPAQWIALQARMCMAKASRRSGWHDDAGGLWPKAYDVWERVEGLA
jgi:hypothetical protein